MDWRHFYSFDDIWLSRLLFGVPVALVLLMFMWMKFASLVRDGYLRDEHPSISVNEAYLDAMLNDEFEIIEAVGEEDDDDQVHSDNSASKRALNLPTSKNELNDLPADSPTEPKKDI